MTPSARILDENLKRLLTRAYAPQRPSPALRASVHAAARLTVQRPRGVTPAPAWRLRLAAAAVVLFSLGAASLGLFREDSVSSGGVRETRPLAQLPAPSSPEDSPHLPSWRDAQPERLPTGLEPDASSAELDASLLAPRGELALRVQVRYPEGWESDEPTRVTAVRSLRPPNTADPIDAVALEEAGSFQLDVDSPGDYRVFVHAPGLGVVERLAGFPRDPSAVLDVTLETAGMARGRVLSATTGEPIADAWVLSERDLPASTCNLRLENDSHAAAFAVRTDAEGRFELAGLRAGVHRLRATHTGFAPAWVEVRARDPSEAWEEVELALATPSSVRGVVRRPNGELWADAVVIASLTSSYTSDVHTYAASPTDDRGEYLIEDLPDGWYAVLNVVEWSEARGEASSAGDAIEGPGWNAPALRFLELSRDEHARIDLPEVREGCTLSGRVLDAEGQSAGQRQLVLVQTELGDAWREGGWSMSVSDADGRFSFDGVPPGEYELFQGRSAEVESVLWGAVSVPDRERHEIELRLVGPRVRVEAREAGSERAAENAVVLLWQLREGVESYAGKFFTDARGVSEFGPVPPGSYLVEVLPSDPALGATPRVPLELRLDDEAQELAFALEPGGAIAVRALDAQGLGVAGLRVRLADERGEIRRLTELERTDADGRFRVAGVPVGRWRVIVERAAEKLHERWVDIERGETTSLDLSVTVLPPKDVPSAGH